MKTFTLDYENDFLEDLAPELGYTETIRDGYISYDSDGNVIETVVGVPVDDFVAEKMKEILKREVAKLFEIKYRREKEAYISTIAQQKEQEKIALITSSIQDFNAGISLE